MDRITLTWRDVLADPAAAAVLLKRYEEKAEEYIADSRTLRLWLESVPPLTGLDDPGVTGPVRDRTARAARPDERPAPDPGSGTQAPGPDLGASAAPGGRARGTGAGPVPAPRGNCSITDGTGDADGIHRAPDGSTWIVPPQRGPAAQAPPGQQAVANTGRATLAERVTRALARVPHRRSLTVRHLALEIGHKNVRSLRSALDRMAGQGLLVKTELHPRAVVYHRTAPAVPAHDTQEKFMP
ncbi:hypothetical protein ABT263_37805 [Kitasatospora sp. NPDC001603]|uniref:hypothetical protein n=1 Tax=Kitasatospora sp. NPDC001603 TaxID=3154388 RepID=UPI00331FAA50